MSIDGGGNVGVEVRPSRLFCVASLDQPWGGTHTDGLEGQLHTAWKASRIITTMYLCQFQGQVVEESVLAPIRHACVLL